MPALLTDLYQLTMLDAYLTEGMDGPAVFECFVRRLPARRNFLVAAGLEQLLDELESLTFSEEEIAWLDRHGGFSRRLLDHLRDFRFTGDVYAMPEGTVFFAEEPLLRVHAPLPQAQWIESRLINILHLQTLVASKAARCVLAARGRPTVDFGMRRAHGAEAAVFAARAAYIAGFAGTATVEAGRQFGIPLYGTMSHAFVQAHASELEAFQAFARARPQAPILLVDTYDTEAAVARLIDAADALTREGVQLGGVRLDSGDLAAHATAVRGMLDAAGLQDVRIVASGNLDEHRVDEFLAAGAPIDSFGIGTALVTSSDAPALDAAYKLQVYAGKARRKRSEGKATWPGIKQVCRQLDPEGLLARDRVQLDSEAQEGIPLLQPCMRAGRRLHPRPSLDEVRRHHAGQIAQLPPALRSLDPAAAPYPVEISVGLRALARVVDAATC